MKLSFFGACRQVTGSNFLLQTAHTRVLIDCGMFQGSAFNEARNHNIFSYDVASTDAVVVSHAHLDHSGRIPKLVHDGFRGKVYGTKGTLKLAEIVWEDALSIMAYEHRKFGAPMLFHADDIQPAASACCGLEYNQWETIGEVRFRLLDAGHIFGSSIIELEAEGKRLVFSGDLGNRNVPILKETAPLPENVDVLLIESTYGDRIHETEEERTRILKEVLLGALKRKGVVLIPAFSIERTQELLYALHQMIHDEKDFPSVPIFLDSPMAIRATEVYRQHPEYYDMEASSLKLHGDFFRFPGLQMTLTRDESKMINDVPAPKVVIAGAGMMNGGRIVHHLFRYIEDPRSTVFIIGYQAEGTLGRKLYEGVPEVTIFGERKKVRAEVVALGAFSAHADQAKLIEWARAPHEPPKRVYMVHGEPHAATALAHRMRERMPKSEVVVPEEGLVVEI